MSYLNRITSRTCTARCASSRCISPWAQPKPTNLPRGKVSLDREIWGLMVALSRQYSTMKNNSLMLLLKRALTVQSPSSNWRCYCSPPPSSSSSSPTNNKLFVAGLSWSVDEKSLTDAFSTFGEVNEVRIMYDKETGRSRGFGFIHFSKEADAESAKDGMDGKAFLGRPLRISFALEKVRGGPVVVPRLTNSGETTRRNY